MDRYIDVYNQGVNHARLGEGADARRALEAARDLIPELPGAWRWLAVIEQADGNFEECVEAACEALRLNPNTSLEQQVLVIAGECRDASP